MNEKKIKSIIDKSPLLTKYFYRKLLNKNSYISKKFNSETIVTDSLLNSTNTLIAELKNKDKLFVGLVKDSSRNNYYSKYEKFLIQNNIRYEIFNPFLDTFIKDCKKYNLIIWRISDKLPDVDFCKQKIYFIEKILKINVFPSYEDVFSYENKSIEYMLFSEYGFKHIPTFFSNDYYETKMFLDNSTYPLVSKEITSCSGRGVYLIRNKRKAMSLTKKVFGEGKKSSFPWVKQKNYILLQSFIPNAVSDIRVICIAGKYFAGYYRYSRKNDFKASGSGIVIKKEIPSELLKTTKNIYEKLGFKHMFAVDYLETENHEYLIIETSQFIGIETSQQTKIKDISGIYEYNTITDSFDFVEGDIWLQELDLKEYLERNGY